MRLLFCILASVAFVASSMADDKVQGEYTFYDDGSHSLNDCKHYACEQARLDALAKKYGTTVSQMLRQTDRARSGHESNDFLALSQTELKGIWIADMGEPEYEVAHDKDGHFIVTCKIRGMAREISNKSANFESLALRNTTTRQGAETNFRHGDDLFLLVNSPEDAYLAVFLEDESRNVLRLLPYTTDAVGRVKIQKNKDYVFFNPKAGQEFGTVDELQLTAPDALEYNRIYVVLSPEPFALPVMNATSGLPLTTTASFAKWLMKARNNDPDMGVNTINIQIQPPHY